MFKKILVANRGEIAVRIIRACREMGIATVAIHSTADSESLHVMLADEAVCVGPPASRESYLDAPNIIAAAQITEADAIHPGIGFLSENVSFAHACEAVDITFIGPTYTSMSMLGDKATAREAARRAGVPVIPGSNGAVADETEAAEFARRAGYPVLVKAAHGGGGRGIRHVGTPQELARALDMSRTEAMNSFGSPDVYLEKFIEDPRHIEVQILGDRHGHVVHLGERDCSVQTPRRQKIVEEGPAPGLTASVRNKLGDAAVKAGRAFNYSCAGTVEFLVDRRGDFYFMEINKRLQVEHCVTEAITGIDLVKAQIRIAAGDKLPYTQKEIRFSGHSIECRINAEQPERNFAPCAGTIDNVRFPGGPGVRVDTHVVPGYEVPPFYDSLLAKIVVWDVDRTAAIDRMLRCLSETRVDGVHTNIDLCAQVISNAYFRRGQVSTDFVQRRIFSQ